MNVLYIVAENKVYMFNGLASRVIRIYLGLRRIVLWPLTALRKLTVFPHDEVKTILFLRHDRIGDMVLSTASLKALRRTFPRARITVLASGRNHDILEHNSTVDEVIIYTGLIRFIKEIRPRCYDLVIDPFLTYELKQAFMTYCAGGRYRIGFENSGREIFFNLRGPIASTSRQMVDYLLDLVEQLGGKREGCEPEVFLIDSERRWAAEALGTRGISANKLTIAIHPGAYYSSQRWPVQRFGELAKKILDRYEAQVILLGSSGEKDLVRTVKHIAGKGAQDFSGLKLRKLMALLSRCDLLVCNNSGPLHIASALKVPTVSMLGPTVTPLWLPSGKHDVVIKKELSCSPCNRAVCRDHECMESITVADVFEAVKSQIARIRTKLKGRIAAHERAEN